MASLFLETPIEYLKGVGPQRAELLKKELQIFTFSDLITFYPFRYVDRTKFYTIKEIDPELPYVQVKGKIIRTEIIGIKRSRRLVASLSDGTAQLELVWFQGIKWIADTLKANTEYIVFGKPSLFKGKTTIAHPEIDSVSKENTALASALQAVYNSGEKLKAKGLDSKGIWKLQKALVAISKNNIPEVLPDAIRYKLNLISREEALKNIHLPENSEVLKKAEFRLKFEELFFVQLKLLKLNMLVF